MNVQEAIAAVKRTMPRPEELGTWRAYSEYTCHFIRNPIAGHIAQFGSQHQRDRAVNAVNAAPLLIAEVERLQAEIDALREASRWIPVVERLPDAYEDVLVVYAESVGEAYIVLDSDAGPQWYRNDWVLLSVTHWRSMPVPPEPQAAPTR